MDTEKSSELATMRKAPAIGRATHAMQTLSHATACSPVPSKCFVGRASACVNLLFLACAASTQICGGETTPAALFKEYLSHPTVVREVVFAQLRCANPDPPQYFTGAVEGANFFLREHLLGENVATSLTPTNRMGRPYFVGARGAKRWEISGFTVHETQQPTDVLSHRTANGRSILETALALGLPGVQQGSFIWDGDRFAAKRAPPFPTGANDQIRGVLTVSNGFPAKLLCLDLGLAAYYDYTDQSSLPRGIPNMITLCEYGQPKARCFMVTEILRLNTDGDLSEDYFEPYRHIEPAFLGINVRSNNAETVVKDNALPIANAMVAELHKRGSLKRKVIVGTFVVLVGFVTVLIIRRKPARLPMDEPISNQRR